MICHAEKYFYIGGKNDIINGRKAGNMKLLNGSQLAQKIKDNLKEEVFLLNKKPKLVCILVGNDGGSEVYVSNKIKACNYVGIDSEVIRLPETISQNELMALTGRLSDDESVNGILIQLPLPKHIDGRKVVNMIEPLKDVDGLTDINLGKLIAGDSDAILSCTAQGVSALLEEYEIPVECRNVVIVGRSLLVGKPLFHLLINKNATVTLCHSKTKNLSLHTKKADILVSAVGSKNLIGKDYVKSHATVIDVAIVKDDDRLCGDVNFEEVKNKVSYISPVPGGVGPLTVAFLLKNTLRAFRMQSEKFPSTPKK